MPGTVIGCKMVYTHTCRNKSKSYDMLGKKEIYNDVKWR